MKTAREVIIARIRKSFSYESVDGLLDANPDLPGLAADTILDALDAAGWQVVPKRANFAMIKEGASVIAVGLEEKTGDPTENLLLSTGVAYSAMLAASHKD